MTFTSNKKSKWYLSRGGLRCWWKLIILTLNREQPESSYLLAKLLHNKEYDSISHRAGEALLKIVSQPAKDAVIDFVLENPNDKLVRKIIEECQWRHSNRNKWLKYLTERNQIDEYYVSELAPQVNDPKVTRMLAHPEVTKASNNIAQAAANALLLISDQEAADELIDCLLEGASGEIAHQIIEAKQWRHSDYAKWLHYLSIRNQFDHYFVSALTPLVNDPRVTRMLAHPEKSMASNDVAHAAAEALRDISTQEAANELIDCWLEGSAGEIAHQIIEEQGLRHAVESRWFLYLAASGRFDQYFCEDFEFHALRPEYLAAPVALKVRIREAVVKAGEVRMNGLFLAESHASKLSLADAEALVRVNIRNQNWQSLIDNIWWLPASQTLEAIRAMAEAKWKPDDAEQSYLFSRLKSLSSNLAKNSNDWHGTLPLNPVFQKWLARGERSFLTQKSTTELEAMIQNSFYPPDQIAALGALRKKGQLDTAILVKAGLSEHWMVRWVAVHFGADLNKAMQVNDAGIEWFRRLAILKDVDALWAVKPCQVTRDGLEALREHIKRLPDRRAAGALLLVEAICSHYTANDIEVEEGAHVMIEEDSFELEG